MILPVVLAFSSAAGILSDSVRCDTTSARMTALAHDAAELRDDSVWATSRKEWGWSGRDKISSVAEMRICQQAAAALVRDGYQDAAEKVAVVRVGKGYVAQPGDSWDLWIVLDSQFRILARVVVPS
jgi:hypothetical protein